MTGIYKITNKINGKIYIGQSVNIFARWNQHYLDSYSNPIKNECLIHKAIRKYGIENFTFEIEEICDKQDLSEREIYFIDYYDCCVLDGKHKGYNMTRGGENVNLGPGENNPNSKLKDEEVYAIREEYKNLQPKLKVYEKYKDRISINTFADVWTGKTWKHIHMDVYTPEIRRKQRNNYDKIKSHQWIKSVTDEEIKKIRNMKNELLPRKYVYETHFSYLNWSVFNDIWYYRTFPYVLADIPPKKGKRRRIMNQNGCNNPSALFSEDQVKAIRERKALGENIKDVYLDYNFASYAAFRNLWNCKTYKNV